MRIILPVIAASGAVSSGEEASKDKPWVNSLGMKFVPVQGTQVLFCIWETRLHDFETFVKATGYDATQKMMSYKDKGGAYSDDNYGWYGLSWKDPGFAQGPTHPVDGVSWDDAMAFCKWLTEKERKAGKLGANKEYRLPTDAEWSIAVGLEGEKGDTPEEKHRGIKDVYPWGNQWPPPKGAGNYGGGDRSNWLGKNNPLEGYKDGYLQTAPVGSFTANKFGLYDMGGNVTEWCMDETRPASGKRVARGGNWFVCVPEFLWSSFRYSSVPTSRFQTSGFRVVVASASK